MSKPVQEKLSTGRRHKDSKSIRQRANKPIQEELANDTVPDSLVKSVESIEKLTPVDSRTQSRENIVPSKKLWPPDFDKMTAVERSFYPQIAADRTEKARIENNPNRLSVHFSSTQTVYMVECKKQRTHKRQFRSRADPWRRYGTLQVIHQIGGWVTAQGHRKNSRNVKFIKPGTPLAIPPPTTPPILTLEDLFSRPILAHQQSTTSRNNSLRKDKGTDDTLVIDEEFNLCHSSNSSDSRSSRDTKSSKEDKK